MMDPTFHRGAVIGTGMMGPGIAMTLALGGVETVILGRTEASCFQGIEKAGGHLNLLAEHGLITPEAAANAAPLISSSTNFDHAVSAADIVIESAPEDMAFKQDLFAKLDSLAKPDAVLASNTSGLSITAIASKCVRPERVMTTHFWNPPHLVPLVEIVLGASTDPALAAAVFRLLERCGKVPVMVKKDTPGQLGNRMQMAMVREAANIVREGIADADAVDTAARLGFGIRLPAYGVLEHQDIVGLEMCKTILEYVGADLYNGQEAAAHRELIAQGKTGAKSGKGFHDWTRKSADEARARRDAFVLQVLKWRKNAATS